LKAKNHFTSNKDYFKILTLSLHVSSHRNGYIIYIVFFVCLLLLFFAGVTSKKKCIICVPHCSKKAT